MLIIYLEGKHKVILELGGAFRDGRKDRPSF